MSKLPLIDRAYVVTTTRRQADRLQPFVARWAAADLDGIVADPTMHIEFGRLAENALYPANFTAGFFGYWLCGETHKKIWQDFYESGLERAMVFEDDAVVPPDFGPRLRAAMMELPADWLGLWAGYWHQRPPVPISPQLVRLTRATQTHAYVLTRAGMWRAFDHVCVKWNQVQDWALADLHGIDPRFYATREPLVNVDDSPSDQVNQTAKAAQQS